MYKRQVEDGGVVVVDEVVVDEVVVDEVVVDEVVMVVSIATISSSCSIAIGSSS